MISKEAKAANDAATADQMAAAVAEVGVASIDVPMA
jgi:hypothetical protein